MALSAGPRATSALGALQKHHSSFSLACFQAGDDYPADDYTKEHAVLVISQIF